MKIKNFLYEYFLISIGAIIYGAAVSLFVEPYGIVPGGFTGLSMIINYFIPNVQVGTIVMCLNVPLIILGVIKFKFKFLASSIYAIVVSSIAMNIFERWGPVTDDPLLASIAGGALMAVGLIMVLMQGATTGGTDIVVKLIKCYVSGFSTGGLFIYVDGCIILLSVLVFRDINNGLYAAICILIASVVIDILSNGRKEAKMMLIVSEKYEEISKRLMEDLDAGVTFLDAHGGYSGADKQVVLCVIRKYSVGKALKIIKSVDNKSFTIFTTADEVFGEGYLRHDADNM